jgi:translation initiation factor 3 subunit C
MSRFFQNTNSDSESEYDYDSQSVSESESEEEQDHGFVQQEQAAARRRKWEIGGSTSDTESEEDKIVIKSKKEKQMDEFRKSSTNMIEMMEFDDWVAVLSEFEKILKTSEEIGNYPRFYIRALVKLEDEILEADKEKDFLKTMNSSNAKAFNAVKQKIKREAQNRKSEMGGFRDAPVDEDESEEEKENEKQKGAPVSFGDSTVISKKQTIFDQLERILEQRGKKNTDKFAQIDELEEMLKSATTAFQKVLVLNTLIPARFDLHGTGLSMEMWKNALKETELLFDFLDQNPNIKFGLDDNDELTLAKLDLIAGAGKTVYIRGSPATFVDRLDDEFFKYLQALESNSSDYIERLTDEMPLYCLLVRAQLYAENFDGNRGILELILSRRVEHLYFKRTSIIAKIEEGMFAKYPSLKKYSVDPGLIVENFCKRLIRSEIDRIRMRALLCYVYHLSLHDKFVEAKNIMLMSHIQDSITQADMPTQSLYNRALVQVGLAAFRAGNFSDCHNALQELCSSGKIKELLAQGITTVGKYGDRTPEQERLDRSRQIPFHMHCNLDLVEFCFLVSAMLLEVPNMARGESKRKTISKTFRRMLEYHDKQVFVGIKFHNQGPPENSKDFIMAASKDMISGEWKAAVANIHSIPIWKEFINFETIKAILKR